jgi:hypothetical protein
MTTSTIRAALAALNDRIRSGEEFPDAIWRVTQRHSVEHDALRDAYDEQVERPSCVENLLTRSARKASARRFTGEPLSGFGALA